MQRYGYTARDERGKLVKGSLIANTPEELSNKISNLGYFLTQYKVIDGQNAKQIRANTPKVKQSEVLQFTFQLSTLLDAGLPLLEGLRDLARESEDIKLQRTLDDIRYRVESGASLKEALGAHPQTFSPMFVNIVGAGEATGKLGQALEDLAALLEWQAELQAKVREAAMYPIILFFVLIGVVTLLVVKVIPMFEPMFAELGAELPLPTQIVLGVSSFVRSYWYVPVLSVLGFIGGYKAYFATVKGRYNIDSWKLKLPVVGDLLRKICLSRFTHTFALSFKAGINLLTCLDIAKDTMANARLEYAVKRARDAVNVGEKLATSLHATGDFPPMVVRMIGVGEQSGSLTQTLEKVAGFYDKEVASTIKKMFSMFEPLMIVFMGVVVGGIAFSVFMPLFKMAQVIGD